MNTKTLSFLCLIIFIFSAQVQAQSRKDLIWEYKKMLRNDHTLNIQLPGDINQFSNIEIKNILDTVWTKKKTIILLQTLGYLQNPICSSVSFSDESINKAVSDWRRAHMPENADNSGYHLNEWLFNTYLKSQNPGHLTSMIRNVHMDYDRVDILLITYKYELEVQLWVKPRDADVGYTYLKSFDITDEIVSRPGPKSKYGDQLTPEGFYTLEFYPSFRWSDFYLAFRVTYPNEADLNRRTYWGINEKSGGDINIHGSCVSIGCIPIGNPDMIELYLLIRANQRFYATIAIYIFPFKFDQEYSDYLYQDLRINNKKLDGFWNSFTSVYNWFKDGKKISPVRHDQKTGNYYLE